jgi:hypothetical protein
MARKFHLVGGSPGRENHPVPTADPADLKASGQRKMKFKHSTPVPGA